MRRAIVNTLYALLLLASFTLLASTRASAATASPPGTANPPTGTSKRGGVTISPAFQQISIDKNEPSITFDFSVTNNTSQEYEFGLSVIDFGSLDETGGVLFAGNAQRALNYRYALSQWVTLEKDRVVVAGHSSEKVPITIVNKESLTPGGHYGAILVTPTSTGDQSSRKVQIDQVASSLLFVKKLGGEVYKLNLKSFSVSPHIFSLPGSVDVRFQNAGNVHVIPRGMATITDPRGRVVKRGIVNADSGIALPESFRHFNVPLQSVATSWLPGRYTLSVQYRYDDVTTTRTVKSSFVYFNGLFIGLLLLIVACAVTLAVHAPTHRQAFALARKSLLWLRAFRLQRPRK